MSLNLSMPDAAEAIDLPDVGKAILDRKRAAWERYPVRANRASIMGHECERFLVYMRTSWEKQDRPPDVLLSIFGEGDVHEKSLLREMADAGFQVIEQQGAIDWREHQITGRIDGALVLKTEAGHAVLTVPVDFKSCSTYTYQSINTAEDIRTHKFPHTRSWYTQMQLYCLLKEREVGLIVMKDKATGFVKQVAIHLDYAYCEDVVQKADRVNAHVAAGTLPDRIPYSEDVCGRCSFFSTCLPDEAARAGTALLDNPEMLEKIRRVLELKKAADEYARLDKEVKETAKQACVDMEANELMVNAEFLVKRKVSHRKGYSVAEGQVETIKIERIGRVAEA